MFSESEWRDFLDDSIDKQAEAEQIKQDLIKEELEKELEDEF